MQEAPREREMGTCCVAWRTMRARQGQVISTALMAGSTLFAPVATASSLRRLLPHPSFQQPSPVSSNSAHARAVFAYLARSRARTLGRPTPDFQRRAFRRVPTSA